MAIFGVLGVSFSKLQKLIRLLVMMIRLLKSWPQLCPPDSLRNLACACKSLDLTSPLKKSLKSLGSDSPGSNIRLIFESWPFRGLSLSLSLCRVQLLKGLVQASASPTEVLRCMASRPSHRWGWPRCSRRGRGTGWGQCSLCPSSAWPQSPAKK